MKIAVIILNYNSSADCSKCVSFLKRQEGVELELVLVDNCSPDADQVEALCREQGCTFIASPENRGYNAGNNIGLRYAAEQGYEYALIANPDMEFPQTDYVVRLYKQMLNNRNVVACGSDICTPSGIHQNPKDNGDGSWVTSFDWIKQLFRGKKTKTVPDWIGNPYESAPCKVLNGCCLLLRLSFVKSINYFDENTFLYGEEAILGRQIELAGKQAYYYADIYAVHNHIKSKEGNAAFRFKHWKQARLLYVRKYSGYPFYGRWLAVLSIHLYFFVLSVNDRYLKSKVK